MLRMRIPLASSSSPSSNARITATVRKISCLDLAAEGSLPKIAALDALATFRANPGMSFRSFDFGSTSSSVEKSPSQNLSKDVSVTLDDEDEEEEDDDHDLLFFRFDFFFFFFFFFLFFFLSFFLLSHRFLAFAFSFFFVFFFLFFLPRFFLRRRFPEDDSDDSES